MSDVWEAFRRATEAFHARRSPATEAALLAAYSAWVEEYAPETAADLIADFAGKLQASRAA